MSSKSLRRAALSAATLAALVAPMLIAADSPFDKQWNVEEYRKKYPYVSLAGRLEYEFRRSSREISVPEATGKRLEAVEKMLAEQMRMQPRAESLKKLHSDEVDAFVKRAGNGRIRTAVWDPTPRQWDLAEAKAITLPKLHAAAVQQFADRPLNGYQRIKSPAELTPKYVTLPADAEAAGQNGPRWPAMEVLERFNHHSTISFANVPGFGHVKDRDQVAGFQAHQFRWLPEVGSQHAREVAGEPSAAVKERWVIRRLELVSLLMHDKPVVYLSEHLPRMGEMGPAPTRGLTVFEAKALKALENGEDVVAEALPNRVRMVGAVRAASQCLKCHEGKRGDLLGTFSYELQRVPPLRTGE